MPYHTITTCQARPSVGLCIFAVKLHAPKLAFLQDHQVGGRALLPAAALLEMSTAAQHMLAGMTGF